MHVITSGTTRLVILAGDKAIKITRFRLLDPFRHLYMFFADRGSFVRKAASYTHSRTGMGIAWSYIQLLLFSGIRANRQEYRIWKDHPEWPIAPVRKLYLGGIVLVMDRCDPATQAQQESLCMRYHGGDLERPHHVCSLHGTPCFVDYGHPEAMEHLRKER